MKRPVELDWQLDWALKARLLAGNGGRLMGALDDRFLSSRLYQGSHPEYPLALPALQALDYHAMGRVDSDFVHVQYVIVLTAFVVTVWALLRPHANPVLLTGGAVAVMASPAVQARVLADPWDVMAASFWVIGALLAGLWYADDDRTHLALAVVFLTAALETKLEALANTLILVRAGRPGTRAAEAVAEPEGLGRRGGSDHASDRPVADLLAGARPAFTRHPAVARADGAPVRRPAHDRPLPSPAGCWRRRGRQPSRCVSAPPSSCSCAAARPTS